MTTAAAQPVCESSRGGKTSVWGGLLPARFVNKKPAPKPEGGAVATAAAAVLDPPAEAHAHTASGASTPTGCSEPAGGDAPQDFGYSRGLDKKYRVLRELGRGGNGTVYVAEQLATGTEFALKSIPKVLTDPKLSEA